MADRYGLGGVNKMTRCARCGRQLIDPDTIDRGVGPKCEKKLSIEALIEIRRIIRLGAAAHVIDEGQIQLELDIE